MAEAGEGPGVTAIGGLRLTPCSYSQCAPQPWGGLDSATLGPLIYFPNTVWFPALRLKTLVCPAQLQLALLALISITLSLAVPWGDLGSSLGISGASLILVGAHRTAEAPPFSVGETKAGLKGQERAEASR